MSFKTDFPDGLPRCGWLDGSAVYTAYHDTEWGQPVADNRALFEQLSLEGFQSGLSWRTILNKREAFRRGFAHFDPERVARYGESEVATLLADAGIVRHRGKIMAVINNAQRALEMMEQEGSLAAFLWSYAPEVQAQSTYGAAVSNASQALSTALKKRGWKFVGPTTMYAFMQAVGMVNDHHPQCYCYALSARARTAFFPPNKRVVR